MAVFKDLKGRPWSIVIDLGSLARVKRDVGIDLLTVHDNTSHAWTEMTQNTDKLLDSLVALLTPHLAAAGVSVDDFASALHEQQVNDAVHAILEGVIDFYPPEKRAQMKRCLEVVTSAARKVNEQTWGRAKRAMDQISPAELEARVMQQLTSGLPATSSLGSSESTPPE